MLARDQSCVFRGAGYLDPHEQFNTLVVYTWKESTRPCGISFDLFSQAQDILHHTVLIAASELCALPCNVVRRLPEFEASQVSDGSL